jgi:hypothetical protein
MSLFDELYSEVIYAGVRRSASFDLDVRARRHAGSPLTVRLAQEMKYEPPPPRSFVSMLERRHTDAEAQHEAKRAAAQQAQRLHKELSARAAELTAEIEAVTYATLTRPGDWRHVAERLTTATARHLLALVPAELLPDESALLLDERPRAVERLREWRARLAAELKRLRGVVEECGGRRAKADALDELRQTGVLLDLEAVIDLLANADENLALAAEYPALRFAQSE